MRRPALFLLATALVVMAAAGAPAQTPPARSGIEAQPVVLEPPDPVTGTFSTTVTYKNHDPQPHRLFLTIEEIWNNAECCSPVFLSSRALAEAFDLSVREILLPAGGERSVTVSGAIPRGERSAYPALIARLEAPPGSSVEARARIASLFLLRGARPWDERVSITDVGLLPSPNSGEYAVFARIKNIGDVHVRPRGTVEIRQGSRVLATVRLQVGPEGRPVAILPTCESGCSLRLRGTWRPAARIVGPVTLIARTQGPDAQAVSTTSLGQGSSTAAPKASVAIVKASPDEIVTRVTNTGSVTLTELNLQTNAVQGGKFERARDAARIPDLAPGASHERSWKPELPDGEYVVTSTVLTGSTRLAEANASLRVGAAPAADDGRSNALVLAIAGLLLVVAAVVLVLFVVRRRRRDEERAPTRTAKH